MVSYQMPSSERLPSESFPSQREIMHGSPQKAKSHKGAVSCLSTALLGQRALICRKCPPPSNRDAPKPKRQTHDRRSFPSTQANALNEYSTPSMNYGLDKQQALSILS